MVAALPVYPSVIDLSVYQELSKLQLLKAAGPFSRKAVLNTAAIGMKSSSIVSKAGKGFFRIRKSWVQTLL